MRRNIVIGCVMIAFLSGMELLRATEIQLVDKGKALCTIVTGKDDNIEKIATRFPNGITKFISPDIMNESSKDLAEHLNKMGGIWNPKTKVKIVKDPKQVKTKYRILLGDTAIKEHGLQKEADKLSYVGYRYKTIGNDLLIFGSSTKGTANGIYGFLQDELGVRWFGPGTDDVFTVIPEKETVTIGSLDKKKEPSFYGRPGTALKEEAGGIWSRRMKMGGTKTPFNKASHYFYRLFPLRKYFKEHPEYYYMRNGKRRNYGLCVWSICYSNPEVVEIAAEAAKNYFRASKHHHSFALGINDTSAYCECPECAKLQPKRTYGGERVASDMYFHFINEVARRVAKEFPDRYIGAIAYNDVTAAPVGDMEKNVFVVLTNDISEYFDSSYKKREEDLSREWEKKGIPLGLYYYMFIAKLVPASYPRHLAKTLKERYKKGYRVLFNEINYWPGPMCYVDARLWWDVDLDVDKLLDEYFTELYGPAGKYMKELYDLFEEIHMRPRKGGFLYEHYKFLQFRPYTAADLKKIKSLLDKAHNALKGMGVGYSTRDRMEERRLAYTTNSLKVFLDMLEGLVLARELDKIDTPLDDIEIMKRLDVIEKINTILNRHEALYRETIIQDPYQSRRYRIDTCTPVRREWKNTLATAVGNALVDMYRKVNGNKKNIDTRTKNELKDAVGIYTSDKCRNAFFKFKAGELKSGENQIRNSGFETGKEDEVFPDREISDKLDWGNLDEYGWAYWQGQKNTGSFGVSDKEKRSGKKSGMLKGIGSNGCFMTLVPGVKEGEVYYAEAYIKNTVHTTREDKPVVSLRVYWLDKNNNWTAHGYRSSVETGKLDQWVKLDQVVQVPKNASKAVILIGVKPLNDDETVYVDDVSFLPLTKKQ